MASRRIEDYAFKYGLSFRQAKRRIGGGKRKSDIEVIARGNAIAGTGKKSKSTSKT